MVTVALERLDGKPSLVVKHADLVAEAFFRLDASARPGGYDDYILTAHSAADRLIPGDIGAINRTFRARSPL